MLNCINYYYVISNNKHVYFYTVIRVYRKDKCYQYVYETYNVIYAYNRESYYGRNIIINISFNDR